MDAHKLIFAFVCSVAIFAIYLTSTIWTGKAKLSEAIVGLVLATLSLALVVGSSA